jgi:predicted enzyme related to lactoylglutathione lyase
MPNRDQIPDGAPCWIELLSSDPDRARSFYAELFGWTSEAGGEEYGGYVNFSLGGRTIAGMMGRTPEMGDAPDAWSIYFATDDVRKTVEAVEANGGTVAMPPMPVPADGHLGHFAFVSDPAGAFLGLWQPGAHHGFGVWSEIGAPSWIELLTTDYEASLRFYRDVLRWDTKVIGDTDEFRYTQLRDPDHEEAGLAGVMDARSFLPEGVPSHWSVYIGVEDADATITKAASMGGVVVQGPDDTPYGRLASLTDPTGAMFKIVQPPADR